MSDNPRKPAHFKTFGEMTPEERKEMGRIGGIKSGETKRRKKAMKEVLGILLDMPMKAGKAADVESIKNFAALRGRNITVNEAILISQIQRAIQGDVKSAEFVRDTSGQRPIEDINMSGSVGLVQIIDDVPDEGDQDDDDLTN